jgi:peptidyl-prolyl cis-trans isomerase B (cyclophilin B)
VFGDLKVTKAIIETKLGDIEIQFFDEITNTVRNFVELTEEGFYNGLTFHRCIPGFVAQGGCPHGTGTGGPGYQIPCETEKNTNPAHRHLRGTISMAHAGKDTGGSQFFLVREPQPHLDGKHTVFGKITQGIEIIDKLTDSDKMNVKIIEKSSLIDNHQLIKI